jgi:hypothetical protein
MIRIKPQNIAAGYARRNIIAKKFYTEHQTNQKIYQA